MFPPMPIPLLDWSRHCGNWFIDDSGAKKNLSISSIEYEPQFNADQLYNYDAILSLVENQVGTFFFLSMVLPVQARYFCTILWLQMCGVKEKLSCVASSGIAALFFYGGYTTHFTFRICFEVNK